MDNVERIVNTALGRKTDRLPFFVHWAMNAWIATRKNWEKQGVKDGDNWRAELQEQTGLKFDEGFYSVGIDIGRKEGVNLGYCPFFEESVIEDRGDKHVIRDKMGIVQLAMKDRSAIPYFMDYPIKNRKDWERVRDEKLDPGSPERFPENWVELVKDFKASGYALQIGEYPFGLFGTLREFMGVEEFLISLHTQKELIHEIMDYLTDFWLIIYEKVCREVKINHIHIWEDMSGRQGSLISPKMVREFMLPNYKKIKKFADEKGIEIFSVDTDGKVDELLPIFIEGGVNMVYPFEVAAGSDIIRFSQQYPNLCIMGGIDKRELAKDKKSIDSELERVSSMFKGKRYIPGLDHGIPPDVSWDNFKYYIKRLSDYIFN